MNNRFFSPKSIVAIGGKAAEEVIYQTQKFGFEGDIYAVHPSKTEVLGIACFPTVADLPAVPDAAFIGIPAEPTIDVVGQLSAMGCGGAVCYASGFAEIGGDGVDLQEQLLAATGDMPIIGPNCYGLLNAADKVALWPDYHGLHTLDSLGVKRGAAIITQSGNVGINFTMQQRGLPLTFVISTGNQAGLDAADYMEILAQHKAVSVIGLHIESIKDAARFQQAAEVAKQHRVPLVCLKSGRSALGAKALASHTSSIAGEDSYYQAFFEDLGITRVDSLSVFIETLKLLYIHPPLPAPTIATISCSGGEASLAADTAEATGLQFPPMTAEQHDKLYQVLGDGVVIANPLDYHTYIWGDLDKQTACFTAVCEGEQAITCKLLDLPDPSNDPDNKGVSWQITLDAFIAAAHHVGKPTAVIAGFAESLPQSVATQLIAQGIAPLNGLETAFAAIAASSRVDLSPKALKPLLQATHLQSPSALDEWKSKSFLKQYNVSVPRGQVLITSNPDLANFSLNFPVVCKVLSAEILHKSDMGGVALNIDNKTTLATAIKQMQSLSDKVLVEEMISDIQLELIANIKADPLFGAVMTVGIGGIMVELLKDSVQLILPTTADEIHSKLKKLHFYPLLTGYRGTDTVNLDSLFEQLLALQTTFIHSGVQEIEINPLLATKNGTIAADALVFE
ncbi:MAG: acyl-CoA synthetase [Gammaproteobacteria bacterium]|nr:MAG: acyl-CoA synthetase [Gammaproteobacteria bacterium]